VPELTVIQVSLITGFHVIVGSLRFACLSGPTLLHGHHSPSKLSKTCNMADRKRPYHDDDYTRKSRSQSPHRHRHRSHRDRSPHRHYEKRRSTLDIEPKELPYNSRSLTKRDYEVFKPMFALYLDIQKGKALDELDETEVKGRWKSFLGKW
jgi:hypothetical protein